MTNEEVQKIAEYVKDSDSLVADLQEKVAALEKPVFEDTAVSATVGKMVEAGFLKESEQEQAVAAIQARPAATLDLLTKLAEQKTRQLHTRLGSGVDSAQKQASNDGEPKRESDVFFEQKFASLYSRL